MSKTFTERDLGTSYFLSKDEDGFWISVFYFNSDGKIRNRNGCMCNAPLPWQRIKSQMVDSRAFQDIIADKNWARVTEEEFKKQVGEQMALLKKEREDKRKFKKKHDKKTIKGRGNRNIKANNISPS